MARRWIGALVVVVLSILQAQESSAENLFPHGTCPACEVDGGSRAPGEAGGEEGPENPFDDPIETDRDSFTPTSVTVSPGRMIFEASYSFIDNRGTPETHSFPEVLIRVGVLERLELRLGWNFEIGGGGNFVSGIGDEASIDLPGVLEESRLLYGFKYFVNNQADFMPRSSVIVQGFTPTSSESNKTDFMAAYVLGWGLPGRCQFDAALHYTTSSEEHDHYNNWAPSAVLRVPVGQRINLHAEYFGIFSTGKERNFTRHFISPGVHVLLTPDVELGVRLGWGLNDQTSRFFSNVGIGMRF